MQCLGSILYFIHSAKLKVHYSNLRERYPNKLVNIVLLWSREVSRLEGALDWSILEYCSFVETNKFIPTYIRKTGSKLAHYRKLILKRLPDKLLEIVLKFLHIANCFLDSPPISIHLPLFHLHTKDSLSTRPYLSHAYENTMTDICGEWLFVAWLVWLHLPEIRVGLPRSKLQWRCIDLNHIFMQNIFVKDLCQTSFHTG